jgi:hypothetical protein
VNNPLDVLVEATRVAREALVEVPLEDALLSNFRAWIRKQVSGLPRSIGGVGHVHFFSKRTFEHTITQWDLVRIERGLQKIPPGHKRSYAKRILAALGVRAYGRFLATHSAYLLERAKR